MKRDEEFEKEECTEICKRLVQKALKMGSDAAEVVIMGGRSIAFSFEKNSINRGTSSSDFGIGIRVLKNKRIGFSFCSREEEAEKTIEKALDISKIHEQTDFIFPEKTSKPSLATGDIFDKKVSELNANECLEFVDEMVNSALEVSKDLISSGEVYCGKEFFSLANSSGHSFHYEKSFVGGAITTTLKRNGSLFSASSSLESLHLSGINFSEIGKEAAELTLKSLKPVKLNQKLSSVLFVPEASSALFEFIIAPAIYGKRAMKNESVYSNKLGKKVASEHLTIVDNGILRGGLNSAPYDDEGSLTRENIVIEKGVAKCFLFDGLSASELGTSSTGNGFRAERLMGSHSHEVPVDTHIRNLSVKADACKMMPLTELVEEVRNGIFVHDIIGAHTSNPSSGDFTVSSPLLFKIENGEIGSALKPVNIRGNFPALLNKFIAISEEYKHVAGSLTPSAFYMPHFALDGFEIY